MKLTKTLRTIAFSGLGLLAGASTLVLGAGSASAAISAYNFSNVVHIDTELTLIGAADRKTGLLTIKGYCGETIEYQALNQTGTQIDYINTCPGVVSVALYRARDNHLLALHEVNLERAGTNGDRYDFLTTFEHWEQERVRVDLKYDGGSAPKGSQTLRYTPAAYSSDGL